MKKNLNKPSNNNPKIFKFNIYWIYAVIFIFFIGLQLFSTDIAKTTNFKDFNTKMLQQGKVEKITIINKEKVFIYIKKEFLSEEQFNNVNKKPIGNSLNPGPHFLFESKLFPEGRSRKIFLRARAQRALAQCARGT